MKLIIKYVMLALLLGVVAQAVPALANVSFQNNCEVGGKKSITQGLSSTNFLQQSFPGCTVTVFIHGTTTLAPSIFADNLPTPTPLSNPFTASTTTGNFLFFAADGAYDVTISGGNPTPGLTPAFTYSNVILASPSGNTIPVSGIVCDGGLTDNSTAFNNAVVLAESSAGSGGTAPTISIPTTGQGCGLASNWRVPSNISVQGSSRASCLIVAMPALAHQNLVTFAPVTNGSFFRGGMSHCTLSGYDAATDGTMLEVNGEDMNFTDLAIENHGGRGISDGNSAERNTWVDIDIYQVRKPVTIWGGANENSFYHLKSLFHGQVPAINGPLGNYPGAVYSINSNSTWVYPCPYSQGFLTTCGSATGPLTPLLPDNLSAAVEVNGVAGFNMYSGSIKGGIDMPEIKVSNANAKFDGMYLEQTRQSPPVVVGGGMVYSTSSTAISTAANQIIPVPDDINFARQPNYTGLCTDMENVFDMWIGPPDFNANSSSPSVIGGGILQNVYEVVTGGFCRNAGVASFDLFLRAQQSTTAQTWPSGYVITNYVNAANNLQLIQSHINGNQPQQPPPGYAAQADNSTIYTDSEVALGYIPLVSGGEININAPASSLEMNNEEMFADGGTVPAFNGQPSIGLVVAHTNSILNLSGKNVGQPPSIALDGESVLQLYPYFSYGASTIQVAQYLNGSSASLQIYDADGVRVFNNANGIRNAQIAILQPQNLGYGVANPAILGNEYKKNYAQYSAPWQAPLSVVTPSTTGGTIPSGNWSVKTAYITDGLGSKFVGLNSPGPTPDPSFVITGGTAIYSCPAIVTAAGVTGFQAQGDIVGTKYGGQAGFIPNYVPPPGPVNAVVIQVGMGGATTSPSGTHIPLNFARASCDTQTGAVDTTGYGIVQAHYGFVTKSQIVSTTGATSSIAVSSPPADTAGDGASYWEAWAGKEGREVSQGTMPIGTPINVTNLALAPDIGTGDSGAVDVAPNDCQMNCIPVSRFLNYDLSSYSGLESGFEFDQINYATGLYAKQFGWDSTNGLFVNLPDGCLNLTAGVASTVTCGGSGGTVSFNSVTAGTNTAALLVGSGGSLAPTGTGTISANQVTLSFAAHKFLGNNTGATANAASSLIGASDISPNSFVAATGSVNALAATYAPAVTNLATGLTVRFLPNLANTTTSPTFNANGLGAKTITKYGTASLTAGDLSATAVATVVYDGTEWQLQNPQTSSPAPVFIDEVPSGTPNGSLTTFTMSYTPTAGNALEVFRNGILQSPLYYTSSANVVTFVTAPISTDTVQAAYTYLAATGSAPTVSTQPLTQTVTAPVPVNLAVTAIGSQPLAYQWYLVGTGAISGATSNVYTISNSTGLTGTQYYCAISNGIGATNSSTATLTVNPSTAPVITTPPSNATANAGSTASFSVVASGSGLSYQWQLNTGSGFANVSGAIAASYTTGTLTTANNGDIYQVIVTNSGGSVTSNQATLTVNALGSLSVTNTTLAALPFGTNGVSVEKTNIGFGQMFHTGGDTSLVNAFQTMAPSGSVLRVGGNSVEDNVWNPTGAGSTSGQIAQPDLTQLENFLTATSYKVIYGINLGGSDPLTPGNVKATTVTLAGQEVVAAYNTFGASLAGIEIGNEQNLYGQGAKINFFAGSLTATTSNSGGVTCYAGSLPNGGSNAYAGDYFAISGFTNSGNNLTTPGLATSSSTTTLCVTNAGTYVSESGATAVWQTAYNSGGNPYARVGLLTSAANASGGNTCYNGNTVQGTTTGASSYYAGWYIGTQGFATAANNISTSGGGGNLVASSTANQLCIANASGVAETSTPTTGVTGTWTTSGSTITASTGTGVAAGQQVFDLTNPSYLPTPAYVSPSYTSGISVNLVTSFGGSTGVTLPHAAGGDTLLFIKPLTWETGFWPLSLYESTWMTYYNAIQSALTTAGITPSNVPIVGMPSGFFGSTSQTAWNTPFQTSVSGAGATLAFAEAHYGPGATTPCALLYFPSQSSCGPSSPFSMATIISQISGSTFGSTNGWRFSETEDFNTSNNPLALSYFTALWDIDFGLGVAEAGGKGINDHGMGYNAPDYAPLYVSGAGSGYSQLPVSQVNAISYGKALANMAGTGNILTSTLTAGGLNITAYPIATTGCGTSNCYSILVLDKDASIGSTFTVTLPGGTTIHNAYYTVMAPPTASTTGTWTTSGSTITVASATPVGAGATVVDVTNPTYLPNPVFVSPSYTSGSTTVGLVTAYQGTTGATLPHAATGDTLLFFNTGAVTIGGATITSGLGGGKFSITPATTSITPSGLNLTVPIAPQSAVLITVN